MNQVHEEPSVSSNCFVFAFLLLFFSNFVSV